MTPSMSTHDECVVSYELAEELSRVKTGKSVTWQEANKNKNKTLTAGFEPTRAMPK
jgi:hypothetical protein